MTVSNLPVWAANWIIAQARKRKVSITQVVDEIVADYVREQIRREQELRKTATTRVTRKA